MTYTQLKIRSFTSTRTRIFNLNQVDKGWVTQILNGSFGGTYEYDFKEYSLNNISRKNIELNVRMTPAVPKPELNSRDIINFLTSCGLNTHFSLVDDFFPRVQLDYLKVSPTTPYIPKCSKFEGSEWGANCVIKEIKYNYSESPATIEFTISSVEPVLSGGSLKFYFGIGEVDEHKSLAQFKDCLETLKSFEVNCRFSSFGICKKSSSKNGLVISDFTDSPYVAVATCNGTSNDGEIWYEHGEFRFRGDFVNNASYGYMSARYPTMSIEKFESILTNSVGPRRIKDSVYGNILSYFEIVLIREGA